MSTEISMGRCRWACRRGMLELDRLLLPFLEERYRHLSPKDQQLFEELLLYPDTELLHCLLGTIPASTPELSLLCQQIRNYASSHPL